MATAESVADKTRQVAPSVGGDGASTIWPEGRSSPAKPRKKLTPEQKYQIFLETQRGDIQIAAVLRKWGIHSSDLTRIRAQVRQGALESLARGESAGPATAGATGSACSAGGESPGGRGPEGAGNREYAPAKKSELSLVGAISGDVVPEAKLALVRAVDQVQQAGMTVRKACEVLRLPRGTYYDWLAGRKPDEVTLADLTPVVIERRASPQRITEAEREAIVEAARDEAKVDLHHRKLAHTLGREKRVYVSESTVYRVLKEEGLVAPREVRRRPAAQRPELVATAPRQVWCWDFSYVKIGLVFWYLLAIIDMYSRKIVGWDLVPQATAEQAKRVWDEALSAEGLLDTEPLSLGPDGKPGELGLKAMSDNGSQMKAKTMREFFHDLGIDQVFSRPHTPEDNAYIESWFATAKCEGIYREEYDDPVEAWTGIGALVRYYNEERLHQGIGFVTPAERHEGRDVAIIEARRLGLVEARRNRPVVNRLAEIRDQQLGEHNVAESKDRKVEGSKARLVRVST